MISSMPSMTSARRSLAVLRLARACEVSGFLGLGEEVPGVPVGELEWETGWERRLNMEVAIGAVLATA